MRGTRPGALDALLVPYTHAHWARSCGWNLAPALPTDPRVVVPTLLADAMRAAPGDAGAPPVTPEAKAEPKPKRPR